MDDKRIETLLAADLADRWIDAILGEQPDVLLQADADDPLSPEDMARNLAQFRATLITELAEQPIAFASADDEEDESEADDDAVADELDSEDEADEEDAGEVPVKRARARRAS